MNVHAEWSDPDRIAQARQFTIDLLKRHSMVSSEDVSAALTSDREQRRYQIQGLLGSISQHVQNPSIVVPNALLVISTASEALALPVVDDDPVDGDFYFYRGLARYRLHEAGGDGVSEQHALLEQAVTDLKLCNQDEQRARMTAKIFLQYGAHLKHISAIDTVRLLEDGLRIVKLFGPNSRARKDFGDALETSLMECHLRNAIVSEDLAGIRLWCRRVLAKGKRAERMLMPTYFAARVLLHCDAPDPQDRSLVHQVMSAIDSASLSPNLPLSVSLPLMRFAAKLSLELGKELAETTLAQNLRIVAHEGEAASALTCSTIGRLSLDVGKLLLRREEEDRAEDHFRESIQWLKRSLQVAREGALAENEPSLEPELEKAAKRIASNSYSHLVVHCCLAEAYLRLQSVVGGASLGRLAIKEFEIAHSIGNPPAEATSLLADAHFRTGRYLKDPGHLQDAIDLKRMVLAAGPATREAWTVLAAATLMLNDLKPSDGALSEAIQACLAAMEVDPLWPWPCLQLAMIVGKYELDGPLLTRLTSFVGRERGSASDIETALWEKAVALIIENTEFDRQVLGGRTQVFTLKDRHRLVSQTLVLKPTSPGQARLEWNNTTALGEFLRVRGLSPTMKLPTPLAIRRVSSDRAIYAMKREDGPMLAHIASTDDGIENQQRVIESLRSALRFLAAYQTWRRQDDSGAKQGGLKVEGAAVAAGLGAGNEFVDELLHLAAGLGPSTSQLVPKKDAHADNWIVGASGLVMLDLESSGYRPVLFEVAQLIDDHPLLPVSEAAHEARLALAKEYLESLAEFGDPGSPTGLPFVQLYALYWSLRSGFGIGYCRRRPRSDSAVAIRRLETRRKHYEDSLQFIAARYPHEPAGRVAALVMNACQPPR